MCHLFHISCLYVMSKTVLVRLTWFAKGSTGRRASLGRARSTSIISHISGTIRTGGILWIGRRFGDRRTATRVTDRVARGRAASWTGRRGRWRGRKRSLVTNQLGEHVGRVVRRPRCTAASFAGGQTEPFASRVAFPS